MDLKHYLSDKKIKQVWLAKKVGVRPSQLNIYANGWTELPEKYHEKLSEVLGVSVNQVKNNNY